MEQTKPYQMTGLQSWQVILPEVPQQEGAVDQSIYPQRQQKEDTWSAASSHRSLGANCKPEQRNK